MRPPSPRVFRRSAVVYVALSLCVAVFLLAFRRQESPATPPRMLSQADRGPRIADPLCQGKQVYVYDMPEKYNKRYLEPAIYTDPACDPAIEEPVRSYQCDWAKVFPNGDHKGPPLSNAEAGLESISEELGTWFATDQHAHEVMYHRWIEQSYGCRTLDPEEADAFYVPFYIASSLVYHTNTLHGTDRGGSLAEAWEAVEWLRQYPYMERRGGVDHILVVGKITWEFMQEDEVWWGNSVLRKDKELPFRNMTILSKAVCGMGNLPRELAAPYATFFHPKSMADIEALREVTAGTNRSQLVSFVGMPRAVPVLRTKVLQRCKSDPERCLVFSEGCSDKCKSADVFRLFTRSVFCLQPPGDSATRRSFFDSMLAGCIPVIFDEYAAPKQYTMFLPPDSASYSVLFTEADLDGGVDIMQALADIPPERIAVMQETIAGLIPLMSFAQWDHGVPDFEDAYTRSINGVLQYIAQTAGPSASSTL